MREIPRVATLAAPVRREIEYLETVAGLTKINKQGENLLREISLADSDTVGPPPACG